MAQGDQADFAARLKALLPGGWFADAPPVLTGVLNGLGAGWTPIWQQILATITQTRLRTATNDFLDMASGDFFGTDLPRRVGETDASFRARILANLLRAKGTRAALIAWLTAYTGNVPTVFEPTQPGDTGAWSNGTMGYGVAGRWGSLAIPFQFFVQVERPSQSGPFPGVSGWGSGASGWGVGAGSYVSLADEVSQITDADLYAAVAETIPAGVTAWVVLTGQPIGGQAVIGTFVIGTNTLS